MRVKKKEIKYKGCGLTICFFVAMFLIRIIIVPNLYLFRYIKNENKIEALSVNEDADLFKVMSYNIRCKTFLDIGKKSWFYRADLIVKNIESVMPDILGFQEVTKEQYRYLKDSLGGYSGIIEYRDNIPWSEGCPIFLMRNVMN